MRQLLLLTTLIVLALPGKSQEKTFTVKKGEAIDLLLLTTNPDASSEREDYFNVAVPIAQEWGYKPQFSYRIANPPTQGNYWPTIFIMATWKDYDKRISFTEAIVEEYPKFHEYRRTIWPTFFLTYWKAEENQELVLNGERTYVATAYWSSSEQEFVSFQEDWEEEITKQGGQIVLELTNGTSPFGYHYNPEYFTITEWKSMEDFQSFNDANASMDHSGVKHVNQFILK